MPWSALRSQHKKCALSLFVGFDAPLRTTETMYIQISHFTFPQRCGPVLLVLPLTKSRQRLQNVPETVTVTDPLVLACVWAVIPRLQPGERLFHASAQRISKIVSQFGTVGSPSSIQVASILFETRRSHGTLHGVWQSGSNTDAWQVGFNHNLAVEKTFCCGIRGRNIRCSHPETSH